MSQVGSRVVGSVECWFRPTEVTQHVKAEPEKVYRVLCDPVSHPRWLIGAQRIRAVDVGYPQPGTAFHHSVGLISAVTVDDRTDVIIADPPNRLLLAVHAGPFDGEVEFLLAAEASPNGYTTRLTMRETSIGPGVALMPGLRFALFARNRLSLQQLAKLIEADSG